MSKNIFFRDRSGAVGQNRSFNRRQLMPGAAKWGLILLLSLLLLPASVALAHNPVFVPDGNSNWDSALLIPEHQVSWAIYARLAAPAEVDFFAFEGKAGVSAYIKMDVPLIEGLEEFRPTMALVGPGLSTNNLSALPVALFLAASPHA